MENKNLRFSTAESIDLLRTQENANYVFGKYTVSYIGYGFFRINGEGVQNNNPQSIANWLNRMNGLIS